MLKNVLTTITTYRDARGWSEYQLAVYSGLPQSTISSWYRKNLIPIIPSLQKICDALGITLSQLFADENVTEQLKVDDPSEWVAHMNNIHVRAMEIVNSELIYA